MTTKTRNKTIYKNIIDDKARVSAIKAATKTKRRRIKGHQRRIPPPPPPRKFVGKELAHKIYYSKLNIKQASKHFNVSSSVISKIRNNQHFHTQSLAAIRRPQQHKAHRLLTIKQIVAIAQSSDTLSALSEQYGISQYLVKKIKLGEVQY